MLTGCLDPFGDGALLSAGLLAGPGDAEPEAFPPQNADRSLCSCSYSGVWPFRVEKAATCTAESVAERSWAVNAATDAQGGFASNFVSQGSIRARFEPLFDHL